jgi:hypothetical protein
MAGIAPNVILLGDSYRYYREGLAGIREHLAELHSRRTGRAVSAADISTGEARRWLNNRKSVFKSGRIEPLGDTGIDHQRA